MCLPSAHEPIQEDGARQKAESTYVWPCVALLAGGLLVKYLGIAVNHNILLFNFLRFEMVAKVYIPVEQLNHPIGYKIG